MSTLHLLVSGGVGGIETLCKSYVRDSNAKNIVVCLFEGGCIADEMQALEVETVVLTYGKKRVVKTLKRLISICKEHRVDTIIAHHAAPLSHIYMMALNVLLPEMYTLAYAHGNAEEMYVKRRKKGMWLRKFILKCSLKYADRVVAISNSVKKSVVKEFSVAPSKITTVYNGTDVNVFAPPLDNDGRFEMIFAGRLTWEKGVQNILEALPLLPKEMDWTFTVVGDGNYRSNLEQKACTLGIRENVVFLGNRRDVPALLRSADCFTHIPDCEEGFGITIIEAMAAGKICVCSDRGAISEIVEDGKNGFLVSSNATPAEVALALEKVWRNRDSSELKEMRQAARERAKDFSLERYVQTLDALIAERA